MSSKASKEGIAGTELADMLFQQKFTNRNPKVLSNFFTSSMMFRVVFVLTWLGSDSCVEKSAMQLCLVLSQCRTQIPPIQDRSRCRAQKIYIIRLPGLLTRQRTSVQLRLAKNMFLFLLCFFNWKTESSLLSSFYAFWMWLLDSRYHGRGGNAKAVKALKLSLKQNCFSGLSL